MTRSEAESIFFATARKVAPSYPESDLLNDIAVIFDEAVRIGQPMGEVLESMVPIVNIWAKLYDGAYAEHELDIGMSSSEWMAGLPADEVVDAWYPEATADDKARLVQVVTNEGIDNRSIAYGISMLSGESNADVGAVIESVRDEFEKIGGTAPPADPDEDLGLEFPAEPNPDDSNIELPVSPLYFEGLEQQYLDFLVSLYCGSFNRSPEHGGLKYWAKELKGLLDSGRPDALFEVAHSIYWAGVQNGEAGSDLSDSDYVLSLYHNALGREPDSEGHEYWLNHLEQGTLDRPSLLTTFLTAAMESSRDSGHIEMRLAVAKFVAQEHITGDHIEDHGLDLTAIINGIDSRAEAVERIEAIVAQYGDAPWVEELASVMSEGPAPSGEALLAEAPIEIGLVGVAGASVDTGADYML